MTQRTSYRLNVLGDFYVEDGCCTLCAMPFSEAPGLFGSIESDTESHCFVQKQPSNDEELDQMVSAIQCAELKCIRYKGTNRATQERLVQLNEGDICDALPHDLQAETIRQERIYVRKRRFQRSWVGRLMRFLRPGA